MLKKQISGLLFVYDLAVGTTISIRLQRANLYRNFCKEWKLKINGEKTKIILFKMGRKLSNEKWRLGTEETGTINNMKYFGVILDSMGK
jgi:uncharacterized protein YneF (UPF0154 family)